MRTLFIKNRVRKVLKEELEKVTQQYVKETNEDRRARLYDEISELEKMISRLEYNGIFSKIDINKILMIIAGIGIASAILKYEETDIVNSKSFGFMSKLLGF